MGGLTALTFLDLEYYSDASDAVLWELRDLTALTTLFWLHGFPDVTDVSLQHLASLTALTTLWLVGTTTKAGRKALKATAPHARCQYTIALPLLRVRGWAVSTVYSQLMCTQLPPACIAPAP